MAAKLEVLTREQLRQLSVVQPSLEILDWVLYDTLVVATGGTATVFTFFQQAVGQAGVTKEQTNMDIPGQLPSGHKFVAQKLVVQPIPSVFAGATTELVDQFNVSHRGYADFNIGTRPYFTVPVLNLIGGHFFAAIGGNAQGYAMSKTLVSGELHYSPVIPANYAFNVTVTYPAAPTLTADVKLRMQMVGKLIRPRQG